MLLQNDRHEKACVGRQSRFITLIAFQLAIVAAAMGAPGPDPAFEFSVVRVRSALGVPLPKKLPLPKKERGHLVFSDSGAVYRSQNGKTSIALPYADIREADVSDPRKILLETYDIVKRRLLEHRSYEFELEEDHGSDLARFLAQRLKRPIIGAYDVGREGRFSVPAYHRHVFGGAHGVMEIGPDGIQFKTDTKADSRTWLYRDIQTIGSSGPFNFRLSTASETYNFDLKERLPEAAYDLAWSKLYNFAPVQPYGTAPGTPAAERHAGLTDGQGFAKGRLSR